MRSKSLTSYWICCRSGSTIQAYRILNLKSNTIQKTEVLMQPANRQKHTIPGIKAGNVELKVTDKFCYLSPWHTADKNRPILSADKNRPTNVGRFFAVTRSIFCRSILSSAWCLQNDRFVRGWSVGSFLMLVRAKQKRKKNRTIWEWPWISRFTKVVKIWHLTWITHSILRFTYSLGQRIA